VNGDCIEADGPNGPRDITVAVATETRRGCDNGADARLIAAAPDLLAAAKLVLEAGDQEYVKFIVRDAISKAEGRE
jgi:hypothetical protein